MRSKEEKRKHKGQESIIGKIIYSFLLFLPLLAIGVTCGYAMFNKNAYQSYASTNESNYTNTTINNLNIGQTYYLITPSTEQYERQQEFTEISVQEVLFDNVNKDVNKLRIYVPSNSTILYIQAIGTDGFTFTSDVPHILSFNYYGINNNYYISQINTILYEKQTITTSYLSDVFYYSVNQVKNNTLFNWAENSIIYTTTNATCNALSITTPFIPLLLSYWLIISVIYFLYDIALMLVWIIHRKIHQLQDSL